MENEFQKAIHSLELNITKQLGELSVNIEKRITTLENQVGDTLKVRFDVVEGEVNGLKERVNKLEVNQRWAVIVIIGFVIDRILSLV